MDTGKSDFKYDAVQSFIVQLFEGIFYKYLDKIIHNIDQKYVILI